MTDLPKRPTRLRLIDAASLLFRQKGYHGTGLSEILEKSAAPKGSLYHHFPNGKADLAQAAARQASEGMVKIMNDAFATADTFSSGVTTLCHKLAKLFDIAPDWENCPISAILFDGADAQEFRALADDIFQTWIDVIAGHATRLGVNEQTAKRDAETLFILIQGSWSLARARRASDELRALPSRLAALG